ncbi:hypothetical protein OSTOST_10876, partial [Ostertagia ostertagi]
RVVVQHSYAIFLSTGIVNQQPCSFVLHLIFCMTFFVSTVLVTDSFIYRYLQVCKVQLFYKLSTKKTTLVGVFLNTFFLLNAAAVIYIAFWPDKNFASFVSNTVEIPGVHMNEATFFGFSAMYGMGASHIALIIELVLVLVFMATINIYCARKVKIFLKNTARCTSFLTLQRQMFILLLVQ